MTTARDTVSFFRKKAHGCTYKSMLNIACECHFIMTDINRNIYNKLFGGVKVSNVI